MKKRENIFDRAVHLIALALVCIAVSGCQGSVNGQAFIDQNGNGIYDMNEMGVPYAKILLTRDGDKIAERYSDINGFFDIPIQRKPGRICVLTDLSFAETNFNYIEQSLNAGAQAAAMKIVPLKAKAVTAQAEEQQGETGETATTETPETTPSVQGWVEDQYCRDIKAKGFEVEIPVNMDFAEAISAMPERLTVKCYAGSECEIVIPIPEGCHLKTMYLPEGLTPASEDQPGVSYNSSLNSLSFDENVGMKTASAQKAVSTSGPAIGVGTFRIITINLKAASDAPLGTTDFTIKPSAECADQMISLPNIPIQLIREIDVAVYQDMLTSGELTSGKTGVKLLVKVENRGKSTVSYGDLTITPPDGSLFEDLPSGCLNNVKKTICRLEQIAPESFETRTITFKLPELDIPQGETLEVMSEATFIAPGMDVSKEAELMKMDVKKQ